MLEAAYIWMVVFTAAALMFFAVAIVVAWRGFIDLKELLTYLDEVDTLPPK